MSDDPFTIKEEKKRSMRLRRDKRRQWVEESFVAPDISDEQAIDYAKTDGFLGTIFTPRRFKCSFGIILVLLGLLLGRSAQLQVINRSQYKALADSNRLRLEYIRSDRGLIYDRFTTPLVRNIPNYVVTLQANLLPSDEDKRNDLFSKLYTDYFINYVDLSLDEFTDSINELYNNQERNDKDIIIADFLKQDHAIMMQIIAEEIPAMNVELLSRREYLNEGPAARDADDTQVYPPVKSLSHLLGYLTPLREGEYEEVKEQGYLFNDVIGRTGLESFYEKELRGEYGKKQIEVNALGQFKQVLNQEEATDGLSIVTSLDVEMQRAVENITAKHLDEYDKRRASIVIMNPQNGELLSLISLPTFDNNDFAKGIDSELFSKLLNDEDNPLFNRAVSGEYPSGSTFKPIVASAALQEGIVSPWTNFLSVGGIRINLWFFPDWRAGGHGQTNVYRALADSVNTYFYIIGGGYGDFEGLGVARISDYARLYGLDSQLGIDLPGEGEGFLPSKEWKESTKNERWYIGDTYHLAIGQGDLLVTPLQLASTYSVFANSGTLYKPHLVTAFADKDLNITREVKKEVLNHDFIESEHITVIRDGLRRVVTQGSGKRLYDLPVDVSGKTGTAQWHSEKPPHAWFAGYAPSDNAQIAFSIMVEEGEEGSGITVSIARDIISWWAANRGVDNEG